MRGLLRCRSCLAGVALLGLSVPVWSAGNPTPADMLRYKPVQKGVSYATPAAADVEKCEVKLTRTKNNGWVLTLVDPKGVTLRKFADTNGDNYPDQWAYFKEGIEVYREIDSNFNGKRDQYRWLYTGGSRVAVDRAEKENGAIEAWTALSLEELSQEVVRSVAARDYSILEKVLLSQEDLKALSAPAGEIKRISDLQKQAPAKFQQTTAKLSQLNENTRWVRVETGLPSRLPADATGMKQDIVMHYRATILCETAGRVDALQLGELVQVGETWKLIDAPAPGSVESAGPVASNAGGAATEPAQTPAQKEMQAILSQIAELDKEPVPQGPNAAAVRHFLKRADLLVQLAGKTPESEREPWQRQAADCLGLAVQAGPASDRTALDRLTRYAEQIARQSAGSGLAAYVEFQAISAEHNLKVDAAQEPEKMRAVQKQWLERLAKFVSAYPNAEDSVDALFQLGMNHDLLAEEAEARKWYTLLANGPFRAAPEGQKAAGALRRLNLEGKPWELPAPVTPLSGGAFSIDRLRGKLVVAYYWTSGCDHAPADFALLKKLLQTHQSKGLEVVAINLDENRPEAEAFLKQHAPPGIQLYAGGGFEGPAAGYYGLIALPHAFLVDREGKVLDRAAQIGSLESDLRKLLK